MTVTIENIIVGAGNLYISSKAIPLETYNSAQRNTYHVGATMDGVEVAYEPDYTDINVDQLKDAAIIYQNGFRLSVRTNLAEATLENLQRAWGFADAQLVAGPPKKLNIPVPPDEPTERKLVLIGKNPADLERKYFARRAIAADTSSHSLRRADATVFPVSFRLLGDPAYSGSEYGYIEDANS
jgi:hypothetical protein